MRKIKEPQRLRLFYFVRYASTTLERSFGMKHNGHFSLTENYYVL